MTDLAKQIDQAINSIILKSENHLELLVGACQSDVSLTNTQEHILMLISDGVLNNSDLAKALNVSQAAVTKAIKSLIKQGMLESAKDAKDGRMTYYTLTDLAKPIAEEHEHHHAHTLSTYDEVVVAYSDEEQAVVSRFLKDLLSKIEGA
ncbi:zinc-dependent MarR family transcriptional regulator [Streptococcus merionis]|uniref:Multiple antibiotic resistance operon transcription repressor MarR n=1 Tax=Streptococcus merionis TaxID=400065 RepID=A0A239SXF2_9STRE|nr:zinc-dependent MarR family transcriptional regulator [Streptococcus merionis]SNU90171.1 multiple antibiotic resistance operon transcription repressor MarR [Streptococcus merionis]